MRSESLGFMRCSESGAPPQAIVLRYVTICMGILTLHRMDSWIRLKGRICWRVGFTRIPSDYWTLESVSTKPGNI